MVDTDDVNIVEGSIRTVKENIKSVVFVSKETGIEVNAYETKYMVKSRDQNAGRSHNINIDIKHFESMEQFQYLRTTLTNQNSIQEGITANLSQGMFAVS